MSDFSWTDEQRQIIQDAIDEEIENSRLAHKLIKEVSLSPEIRSVPWERYNYADGTINEDPRDLLHPSVEPFFLTKLQTEDKDLKLAQMRARRAAQKLARNHDKAVFKIAIRDEIDEHEGNPGFHNVVPINKPHSDGICSSVAEAVAKLDNEGYRTSYVLVAGNYVYTQLHTRAPGAADLPVKAVQGLLEGGPIQRSGVLPKDEALVLSISGEEMDRAVAEPPTLQFLRIGDRENREFDLRERFLTRFKQTYAAVLLRCT